MNQELKRTIGFTGLVFYGVGTMIGGGIYALLGSIVAKAGIFAPWSMVVAGLMAVFSALTFAELSARFPASSGPAKYITEAFQIPTLGSIMGWLVIATGVVSAATLTAALSGFFADLIQFPPLPSVLLVAMLMCGVAAWGIKQSVAVVALVTTIEVAGLVAVIGVNFDALRTVDWPSIALAPDLSWATWSGIFAGGFLAFYAFIGFEDLVTLAEEVKSSAAILPKAIIVSLIITITLYVTIAFVAVLTVDLDAFSKSKTPMAFLVRDATWLGPTTLTVISLLAGFNGGLVQVVMAARILYGMARDQQAPRCFAIVHPKTQTPLLATALITVIVIAFALIFNLTTLASITSGIILFVFASMNLSLLKIKQANVPFTGFQIPKYVPVMGLLLSIGSLFFVLLGSVTVAH